MLPDRYTPELELTQNYYGDTFDSETFVDRLTDRLAPPEETSRESFKGNATAELLFVTGQIGHIAGQNLTLVDEALQTLANKTSQANTEDAINTYVRAANAGRSRQERMTYRMRQKALTARAGVIVGLQIYRNIERDVQMAEDRKAAAE
jgi:hypothetical protein